MSKRHALSDDELTTALEELPGWSVEGNKLHRDYKFDSFATAIGWMMSASIEIDKLDHHPEWSNVYNRVTVDLTTHDLDDQISTLDVKLAHKLEQLASAHIDA